MDTLLLLPGRDLLLRGVLGLLLDGCDLLARYVLELLPAVNVVPIGLSDILLHGRVVRRGEPMLIEWGIAAALIGLAVDAGIKSWWTG